MPLLSGAVNDIHRLSVNNEFKKEVAELLETEQDVEQELLMKLNKLSEKHSLNDRVKEIILLSLLLIIIIINRFPLRPSC